MEVDFVSQDEDENADIKVDVEEEINVAEEEVEESSIHSDEEQNGKRENEEEEKQILPKTSLKSSLFSVTSLLSKPVSSSKSSLSSPTESIHVKRAEDLHSPRSLSGE